MMSAEKEHLGGNRATPINGTVCTPQIGWLQVNGVAIFFQMPLKLTNVPKGLSRTNVRRGKFQIKERFIRSTRTWLQKAFQAAGMNAHRGKQGFMTMFPI